MKFPPHLGGEFGFRGGIPPPDGSADIGIPPPEQKNFIGIPPPEIYSQSEFL